MRIRADGPIGVSLAVLEFSASLCPATRRKPSISPSVFVVRSRSVARGVELLEESGFRRPH